MIKEKTNLGNFVLCKGKQICCQWAITSLLYLSLFQLKTAATLLFLSSHLYPRAQYISWELWLKRSNNKSYQYCMVANTSPVNYCGRSGLLLLSKRNGFMPFQSALV